MSYLGVITFVFAYSLSK